MSLTSMSVGSLKSICSGYSWSTNAHSVYNIRTDEWDTIYDYIEDSVEEERLKKLNMAIDEKSEKYKIFI